MFRAWLRITPSPSYQQLVEALVTVREVREADHLSKKYSTWTDDYICWPILEITKIWGVLYFFDDQFLIYFIQESHCNYQRDNSLRGRSFAYLFNLLSVWTLTLNNLLLVLLFQYLTPCTLASLHFWYTKNFCNFWNIACGESNGTTWLSLLSQSILTQTSMVKSEGLHDLHVHACTNFDVTNILVDLSLKLHADHYNPPCNRIHNHIKSMSSLVPRLCGRGLGTRLDHHVMMVSVWLASSSACKNLPERWCHG